MDAVDEWVDTISQGRSNISPDKIPWDALQVICSQLVLLFLLPSAQTLLESTIYGGRIDNDFDMVRVFCGIVFVHLFTCSL
jgi:dynein heavy chain 1